MISDQAWYGVNALLDEYVQVRASDTIRIIYSPDAYEAAAWVSAAASLRSIDCKRVLTQPLYDPNFYANLSNALPRPEELPGRLVILTFERETMSHDDHIRKALSGYSESACVVMRSISSCEELFSTALHISPETISKLNASLLEKLMPAKSLNIKTKGGTDLNVAIDSQRYSWISNRGKWRPGSFVILPAGEVATYPANIEGILVADFAFNVNALTSISASLSESPVTIEIEGGRAVRYECEDSVVKKFLNQCFDKHCAFNVGELGFGTNSQIKVPISLNSHINERCPGIHLGFGQHNQLSQVSYRCNIHLDLIAKGGVVSVDGGAYKIDLEKVRPSETPHPMRSRDEDVFSPKIDDLEIDDCCGILSCDGLQLFDERGQA